MAPTRALVALFHFRFSGADFFERCLQTGRDRLFSTDSHVAQPNAGLARNGKPKGEGGEERARIA